MYSDDQDYFDNRKDLKISVIIDTNREDTDVEKSASLKERDFKAVDTEVRNLYQKVKNINDFIQATDIALMQDYQLKRENEFSEHQFENSHRMVFIIIVQVVIISIIGLWQIFALKRVFKEKMWSPY